jgi:hypothetical protein
MPYYRKELSVFLIAVAQRRIPRGMPSRDFNPGLALRLTPSLIYATKSYKALRVSKIGEI